MINYGTCRDGELSPLNLCVMVTVDCDVTVVRDSES